jgi:glucokinase
LKDRGWQQAHPRRGHRWHQDPSGAFLTAGRSFKLKSKTFPSKQYPGLEPVVEEFLADQQVSISCACFGIAGPVVDGQVKTPICPGWSTRQQSRSGSNWILSLCFNDLEAAAYGIFTLEPHELFALNEGVSGRRKQSLDCCRHGLGRSNSYDDGRDYHPSAFEGGYGDFAPHG